MITMCPNIVIMYGKYNSYVYKYSNYTYSMYDNYMSKYSIITHSKYNSYVSKYSNYI